MPKMENYDFHSTLYVCGLVQLDATYGQSTMPLLRPLLQEAGWGARRIYPPRHVRLRAGLVQDSRSFGIGKSVEIVPANRCPEQGPLPAYIRLVKEGKIREDAHQLTALNVLQQVREHVSLWFVG